MAIRVYQKVYRRVYQRGGIRPHRNAPMCTLSVFGGGSGIPHDALEMKGADASQHRPAPTRINLPGMDSNHDEEYQNLLGCNSHYPTFACDFNASH